MNEFRSPVGNDASQHFNEPQRSRILASVSYIDKLLIDVEEILSAATSHAFPKYKNPLTPAQIRVAKDYISRLRQHILHVLKDLDIQLPPPKFDSTHSIRVTLQFIEVAIEEMAPERLVGYGEVPRNLTQRLAGGLQEMKGIVRQMDSYLIQRPEADLSLRVGKLPDNSTLTDLLSLLTKIIDHYGLVEFRSPLARILDKLETPTYEIAFFGRVSAGKSSLLNRMIGTELLPTGVTPITAVPTRIRNRPEPALLVWTGDGRIGKYELGRIADFVTEARNPGNEKRVTRVIAEFPVQNLPEEVVLVDTPGLGSLALQGAEETLAYLPQCDLGVVLVDASSNLHSDDVATLDALRAASVPGVVVLSKADLIPASDVEQLVEYTRRKVEEQVGSKIDVSPWSSHPEMGHLLERWVAHQITPRIADARRLADESNQRKATHLAERVLHALEMSAKATRSEAHISVGAELHDAEVALRDAAGLIDPTNDQCYRITGQIREAAQEAIRSLADAAINTWQSGTADTELHKEWIRNAVNAVAQTKAQQLAGLMQTTAQKLSAALNTAAQSTSTGVSNEHTSLESLVKELPPADFHGCELVVRRLRLFSISVNLARRSLVNQLESQCGASIVEFYNSYGRALELWFRNTLLALDREFNSMADVYRAQLQRLAGSASSAGIDNDAVLEDIQVLKQRLGISEPINEPAPPSRYCRGRRRRRRQNGETRARVATLLRQGKRGTRGWSDRNPHHRESGWPLSGSGHNGNRRPAWV
jgi:GTP-binding protein EngB required for normal cell division